MKNPIYIISNGIEDFYFQTSNPQSVREKYHLEGKKDIIICITIGTRKESRQDSEGVQINS